MAIRVLGAHTGIGVGLPSFLGSGRGSAAYDLAFLGVRSVHCEVFFWIARSRTHCLNIKDIFCG